MKSRLAIIAIACLALVIGSLPITSWSAEGKNLPEIEIKMSMPGAQNVTVSMVGHWIKKWVEEITGGRAKVKIFWTSSLVPLKDHYRALQVGIVDLAFVNTGLSPGAFPLTELFQVPGIAARIPASNLALMELFRKYPQFEKQFSPKVKYISTCQFLLSDLHTKKPVRRLKDLKGMKIGCQTAQGAQAMKQLGASASTIAWTDMYLQLERGVVDGVVAAWGIVNITRLHEIAKCHTLLRLTPALAHWMFNRNTWNKFTPDEQKKFELLEPWINYGTVSSVAMTSHNMRSKEITPEKGHTTIEFPKEDREQIKKLFRPLWDEWAEKMEKKGYPGKAILNDALRLTATYSYE
jgi:TRAP-type C4-dicarboxylate transport system substrate-binding protein